MKPPQLSEERVGRTQGRVHGEGRGGGEEERRGQERQRRERRAKGTTPESKWPETVYPSEPPPGYLPGGTWQRGPGTGVPATNSQWEAGWVAGSGGWWGVGEKGFGKGD